MSETPYIQPNLSMALSLDSLIEDYKKYGRYMGLLLRGDKKVHLSELLSQEVVFVVAEPGSGKTRLLKELYDQVSESTQKAQIDLKLKTLGESIEDFIKSEQAKWKDEDPAVVLLDGLDEVAGTDVQFVIRHIKGYISKHKNHKVIVSSRLHYFGKFESQFADLSQARYVMVEPFELYQSRQFLVSLGIEASRVESIIKSLRLKRDGPLVIQNPRYLEFLAVFLNDNPEVTEKINRAMIFDNFVDNALAIEDEKKSTSLKSIKRKFLERLAFTMEIAQRNVISERDFTTFIDTAKSDAKLALISQTSVDDLYVHSLLKKDDEGNVGFDNAEVQEYLAATAIMDMKDQWHTVFDVAIDENLRELYPSWENAISFLIDEKPEILPELAGLKDNPQSIAIDESWHKLLTSSTSNKLSDEYKSSIFDRVYSYYFKNNLFISDDLAFNLANYALSEHAEMLIKTIKEGVTDDASKIHLQSASRVAAHLVELGKLTPKQSDELKSEVLSIALSSTESHIQTEMVDTLAEFKDPSLVTKLLPLSLSDDSNLLSVLQATAVKLDLNSKDAVKIFIAGVKNDHSSFGRHNLMRVDNHQGIKNALSALSKDPVAIFKLIEHNNIFSEEEKEFIEKIREEWKNDLLKPLKTIVSKSFDNDYGYYASRSTFVAEVIKLIAEKDPTYFKEILDLSNDKKRFIVDDIAIVLAASMRVDDVKTLVDIINDEEIENMKWIKFSVLRTLSRSDHPNKDEMILEARKLLPEMYKLEDERLRLAKKEKPQNRVLDEFNKHIKKAREGSMQDLADALTMAHSSSKDQIIPFTSEDDLEFLWTFAKEKFLDAFDPAQTYLKILNRTKDGTQNYSISMLMHGFTIAIEYAVVANRKGAEAYREKLIHLIPYAYSDSLNAVLETVGTLTPEEEQIVVEDYTDLGADKAQFMLQNFLEVVEKYNFKKAVPVLDKIIDLDTTYIWNRVKALELSEALVPNPQRLQEVFDTYKDNEESKEIALKANGLLITKHQNKDAIEWLVEYLKKNAFEHIEQEGGHFVDGNESELHEGKITASLKTVVDPSYQDLFQSLLKQGLDLLKKNMAWHNYAYYLWQAVDAYFINLANEGEIEPFDKLQKFVNDYDDKVVSAQYISHLNTIKRSYLEKFGKPETFADAINKHNTLSEKKFLPINSDIKLFEVVYELIDKKWRGWVTHEGRQFVLEKKEQTYVYMELKNILLESDIPKEGIRLLREAQAVDGTGTDFMVYYGFYGPVIIELKRSGHPELSGAIKDKDSFKSMQEYMRKFNAKRGIVLVYDDQQMDEPKWDTFIGKVKSNFEDIEGVFVIGVRVVVPQKPKPTTPKPKSK